MITNIEFSQKTKTKKNNEYMAIKKSKEIGIKQKELLEDFR